MAETAILALKYVDQIKRANIAEILGRTDNGKAVTPLIDLLSDEIPEVRLKAVVALGEIGDIRAVEHLEKIAEKDSNTDVKNAARTQYSNIKRKLHNQNSK